ncbi:transcriptional regulator TetR/AcrR family [Methanobrevibacter smithii CAG:186]|uniref:Transcriptional regulator TetR/AcrR family n=1 Tax=Methanobrevibacter smithii CAG:186 TaxID=1263088 RepID=R7PT19_METSM|nr:TetR/AcrR family transcriptional regulator [Methanobrevibacter smithii]CDF28510.1 transcriptional regulator TetR/AcrR family [Methanobrevibacter smithii CAG:186]
MKTQTKDKIFDMALDLFSKKGYDSVSVRTIASEVGIKESSIYNHYSSKKDILMSILNYFEEYFKGNPLDDENIRKLLEENPEEFYHQGSDMFKQQIFEEKILKIMKLIFVQMYQIDEVKEFFLREILGGSTDFWSDVFEILIQKNVIGSDCNPNKLAEMYFGFSMFKLWEIFLKYDDFPKAEIEIMFDEVEEYHKFLLDSVRADKNE